MSASTKPRGTNSGKPETALAQLKAVWLRLPEATQDYWREQFCSSRKQSDLRAEIAKKLSVKLPADSKLTYFRDWLDDQDARDKQSERMAENERRIKSEHPNWTLDQVREETLKQSYFEALATGDFKMGLKTVTADVKAKSVTLDREKFEFDASKACLAQLPKLKAISTNKTLSEADKVNQTRQLLFGILPK